MTKCLPEEISLSDEDSAKEFDSNDTRLIYKHNYGTVELHKESLECLEPQEYLNDKVVEFYLAYLLKEVCTKQISKKVHIFDSIFHKQLEKVFEDKTIDIDKLQQIRRWYEGVDIFDKQFLIFPVCSDRHWFALVVCYPSEVPLIGVSNDDGKDLSSRSKHIPGIIIMDSLNLKNRKVTAKVRDFLDYEWRDRRKDIKRFSHSDLKDYHAPLPTQRNAYDCGIFMLMYIKCFIELQPENAYRLIRKGDCDSLSHLKGVIDQLIEINNRSLIKNLIEKSCQNDQ